MLVVLFHFSKWGSESLNIVFLKTAQVIGFAGESQYASLIRVCKKVGNHDCVEGALKSRYHSSENADHLKELALFQLQREKNKEAVRTYEKYFQKNGTESIDKQSAYNYAKLLEKVGQKEKALEYYETILSQRKATEFPVSVVRSTVHLLVNLRRDSEAQSLVKQYKALAEQDNYLQQEVLKWEKTISRKI